MNAIGYDPYDPEWDPGSPKTQEISRRVRKARKEHTCDECNGKIRPGDTYTQTVYKYDGEIIVGKHHGMACHPYNDWKEDREGHGHQ